MGENADLNMQNTRLVGLPFFKVSFLLEIGVEVGDELFFSAEVHGAASRDLTAGSPRTHLAEN
jgi:hypothetical protein